MIQIRLRKESNIGKDALIPSRMDIMIISEGVALNGKKKTFIILP